MSLLLAKNCIAQNDSTLTLEQINNYSNQSKQLISYLEGTLNFLGNPNELPSDKDIIFNSSYLKIFKNSKVQIEDDLDENRETPLNKDVQAYLKDIDFFYKDIVFDLEINEIDQLVTDSGIIVFKLTINRQIKGITIDNDTVENNQLRYIEINLDPLQQDLKIVSIYTTKIKEKEELKNWWNNMSADWKNFFGKSIIVYDTLPFKNIMWFSDSLIVVNKWIDIIVTDTTNSEFYNDTITYSNNSITIDSTTRLVADTIQVNTTIIYNLLKTFRSITFLNISNNLILQNINPVSELTELKEINISNTLISNITPIRNLNKLVVLNLSNTPISTLEPLRYITTLNELNCSNTGIQNIDVLSNLQLLSNLNLSNTNISELNALTSLRNLVHLSISGTNISECSSINNLNSLSDFNLSKTKFTSLMSIDSLLSIQNLNIDSTNIVSLEPLSRYENLTILQANNTSISDISPLVSLKNLKVIYCDNSDVTMEIANSFMDKNPKCLVIYNSQELLNWWNNLNKEWKSIFKDTYNISLPITKEKLHQLINQTKLSVAYNRKIKSLQPVRMLHRLEEIDIQQTQINDLTPLAGLTNLEIINLNQTEVTTLESISSLKNLSTISFENTEVTSLSPLTNSNSISNIYCDKSRINTNEVIEFKKSHPACLIVYQSEKLRLWWNNLDLEWQQELGDQLNLPSIPSKNELQQLVDLKSLTINNNLSLSNLNPLHIFINLQELTINSTSVTDISPLASLTSITRLNISSNPITDLEPISKLYNLTVLKLENTSVEDLEPVSELSNLKLLNIAGTRVKTLKYIQNLANLEKLYINNTRIRTLKQLSGLSKLTLLQCYNTSLKTSRIEEFKISHPKTEIIYY